MLSYLHGFHAGNHADVVKHTVLTAALARLAGKAKPLRYVDTHAGAGVYDLESAAARKNREHDGGIARIFSSTDAPPAVARLLELVRDYNGPGALHRYPGSPWLARASLRRADQLYLFELHPAEQRALARAFDHDRHVKVLHEDGLRGCIGLVPPPERRGLLLIDPSYERAEEQPAVIDAAVKAHRRFATGVIAVWYPVLERRAADRFERALRAALDAPIATYELCIARESATRGLIGSGVLVVNPPWQLDDDMAAALPWLKSKLERDGHGSYRHEPPQGGARPTSR
jgi:23S rRNA (adenine2030-N6)-methyltransferase